MILTVKEDYLLIDFIYSFILFPLYILIDWQMILIIKEEFTYMGQYSESVYFGPLKVREKKCLRNWKSFVELENYVALWLH